MPRDFLILIFHIVKAYFATNFKVTTKTEIVKATIIAYETENNYESESFDSSQANE